jgi:hypothetical protein
MITIRKQEAANWLLFDYQATLHTLREKLRLFEQKYEQSWNAFEHKVKISEKEIFSQWDDYMEWKAYVKMSDEIEYKIEEVKHGHFEIE